MNHKAEKNTSFDLEQGGGMQVKGTREHLLAVLNKNERLTKRQLFERMRENGYEGTSPIHALQVVSALVREGIVTDYLDGQTRSFSLREEPKPAPVQLPKFPKCSSVMDWIVHHYGVTA